MTRQISIVVILKLHLSIALTSSRSCDPICMDWDAEKYPTKDIKIYYYRIHQLASGGYYGFRFVTPPPQCVERFHHYRSNEKIL